MSKVEANAKKQAKELARKFQLEFVDLKNFELDYELVRSIPVNLMIKHRFIPLEKDNQGLKIAIADPSDLPAIDELEATLGVPLILSVASADEIDDFLKKSQASQRVLEEASRGFLLKLVKEEEEGISLFVITSRGPSLQ